MKILFLSTGFAKKIISARFLLLIKILAVSLGVVFSLYFGYKIGVSYKRNRGSLYGTFQQTLFLKCNLKDGWDVGTIEIDDLPIIIDKTIREDYGKQADCFYPESKKTLNTYIRTLRKGKYFGFYLYDQNSIKRSSDWSTPIGLSGEEVIKDDGAIKIVSSTVQETNGKLIGYLTGWKKMHLSNGELIFVSYQILAGSDGKKDLSHIESILNAISAK